MKSKNVDWILKHYNEPRKENGNWLMVAKYKDFANVTAKTYKGCYEKALKTLNKHFKIKTKW